MLKLQQQEQQPGCGVGCEREWTGHRRCGVELIPGKNCPTALCRILKHLSFYFCFFLTFCSFLITLFSFLFFFLSFFLFFLSFYYFFFPLFLIIYFIFSILFLKVLSDL